MKTFSTAGLARLGIAVSIAVTLSACGSSSTTPAATSSAPSSSDSAGSASPSGVPTDTTATLKVWHYLGTPTQQGLIKDETALFNKTYPNVTVENTYVPAEQLPQKILAATATGTGPDVIVGDGTSALTLDAAGAIYDMSSLWSSFADASQFPDSVQLKSNGKLLGAQGYVNTIALYYNKDELDKAGVQPPKTVDELKAALTKLKAAGIGGLTLCGKPTVECEFQAYPWLLGDGVSYDAYDATKAGAVFNQFSSMVSEGTIPKEVVNWAQSDALQQWLTGKYAFTENGNWQLAQAGTDAKFKWGVTRLPAGSAGSHVVGGGETESIGANTKNAQLAFAYLASTWFSKAGQLIALKTQGSLPTRKDAATDPAIASDSNLSVFVAAVGESGAWPSNVKIADARQQVGTAWSNVLSGQQSPTDAATSLGTQLKTTLGTS
jgi:multiple sugar transport system substrate-binding protein